jgi:hypothetical protein
MDQLISMYVRDSAGFRTSKNYVLTISDSHFAPFSDMSMGHKISLELRIKKKLNCYFEKSFFDS